MIVKHCCNNFLIFALLLLSFALVWFAHTESLGQSPTSWAVDWQWRA